MGKAKKQDKANQHHFQLVGRSLTDPLHDVEGESQSVLAPFVPTNNRHKKAGAPASAPGTASALQGFTADMFGIHEGLNETDRELLEARVYGIKDIEGEELPEELVGLDGDCYFPPDGYKYDRHLKTAGTSGGTMMHANPLIAAMMEARKPVSPEEMAVLAALEEPGYEECNQDWIDEIVDEVDEKTIDREVWGRDTFDDDDEDLEEEDVVRGEEDDEFDALMDEYDDDQIGCLDDLDESELCGHKNLDKYESALDEYLAAPERLKEKVLVGIDKHLEEQKAEEEKEKEEALKVKALTLDVEDGNGDDLALIGHLGDYKRADIANPLEYDCESILSFRSNLSNHPGKVSRPDRIKVKNSDLVAPPAKKLKALEEGEEDEEGVELPEVITFRQRGEQPEDRKIRKAAVKEHQKIARQMKKETKLAFKNEAKKAHNLPNAGDIRDGVTRVPM